MSYQDKQITCVDCGTSFTFTPGEQEAFATRGYTNEPKRCQPCRVAKKQSMGGNSTYGSSYGSSAPREMHAAVCASCGKDTQVPFKPRGDKPVYCSDCYRKTNPVRR
jgi:CxxC-x17-CxxC domain-containing protein